MKFCHRIGLSYVSLQSDPGCQWRDLRSAGALVRRIGGASIRENVLASMLETNGFQVADMEIEDDERGRFLG